MLACSVLVASLPTLVGVFWLFLLCFVAGDTLRLALYSTDFEHTVRDNREVSYAINLEKSRLYIPKTKKERINI